MAPTPKRAGPRRSINLSGAIAAESCQHFVTMFGDYNRMTRDENLNAMIQELRERSGLPDHLYEGRQDTQRRHRRDA